MLPDLQALCITWQKEVNVNGIICFSNAWFPIFIELHIDMEENDHREKSCKKRQRLLMMICRKLLKQ